ncbi:MAG TPA: nitrous oxide reductase family maturation protein NosD [Vicinamibacterales bacterium]|nr:nitrous oxide reductase family maturation protein NosD [Vicinamibacterales bacterium]
MTRARAIRMATALGAAALIALSTQLPLWSMKMEAPQYRHGLYLHAYGTAMTGDIRELSILNHYIGMPPIEAPEFETSMFPIGIAALVLLCVASPLHGWIRRVAVFAVAVVPLTILGDLQWRLYQFGHTLNPKAPIRLKPFTPLVIGETHMGNFESHAMVSWGFACIVVAALLLWIGGRIGERFERRRQTSTHARTPAIAAMLTLILLAPTAPASAQRADLLQPRIDAAPRGSTVVVARGIYTGPIVIRGPLTLIAEAGATIDGGGHGSVVTIQGDDVVFRGFTVRNSGREVTEEASGIKITGNRHRVDSNYVHDVYFGIHIGDGEHAVVEGNRIVPGQHHGARPGHGISAWHLKDSALVRNDISDARDGIYLSFTDRVVVSGNTVTGCRYGLHSMYSHEATFENNTATANLLGAALMMSDRLILRGNRIRQHRQGPAAYGVLLKDIGDLDAADNEITSNRVGIYAESVPTNPAHEARFTGNVIAGNEVGLALQSTAALTMSGNRIAENLTDVRPLGRQLSQGMRWTREGRGNSWGQYRGYDADGDGIGDVPYRVEDAMDALVRRNPLIQTFLYTPAHLALEAAARMFPLYRQPPVLVDERPLMSPAASAAARASKGRGDTR